MQPPLVRLLLVCIALLWFVQLSKAQPVVVGNPSDTAICVDASASFRVIAVNTAAYQWQENDGVGWYNITSAVEYASGFNTPLLTISDANLGLNGYQYRCVVFDAEGAQDISEGALLGVYEPPIITVQPADIRVCKNETALFSVNVLGGTSFAWQENIGQGWVYLEDNAFYQGTDSDVLEVFTTTGMNGFSYRCVITNVSCPDTTINAKLFVDPTPIVQQITGGGSYCSGGSGVEIGLADSETGISYQLFRNNNATGIVISGNNEPLSFGMFTQEGVYTVLAINGFTSCNIAMDGQAEVAVSPLPQQQQLLGGGAFCPGEEVPEIYLAGTETGVTYQLFLNGVFTGNEIFGNGFVASFGRFADPGLYSVMAVNVITGCSIQLETMVQVSQYNKPAVFAGSNQLISRGEVASLNATATGGSSSYTFGWMPQAYVQQPDLASTQTIPLFQSRQFIISAVDQQTGCAASPDTLLVYVEDGSLDLELIASQTQLCPGESAQLSAIAGGGTGNYSYQWTSLPEGFSSQASQVLVYPEVSTTYFVTLNDGENIQQKSVSIQLNPLPSVYSITGEGNYCAGEDGVEIGLSGSENGVIYKLLKNGEPLSEKTGTGQELIFGDFPLPGIYTATAQFSQQNCLIEMQGELVVNSSTLPVVAAGSNQYIETGTQTTLYATASGGSGNFQFNWTPVEKLINPNTANAATLALFETSLFEVVATDIQTGCESNPDQTVVFVTGGDLSLQIQADQYSICPGEPVQLLALPSGGSGNYVFQWQSIPSGFSATIANPIDAPSVSTQYVLTVTDGFSVITDSVFVTVRPQPQAFNLSGGGAYCSGADGPDIVLEGSESAVFYSLFRNGQNTGQIRIGNESAIVFQNQQLEGTYQVEAFSQQQLCGVLMPGSVNIELQLLPEIFAGYDRTIQQGTITNLNAQVTSGSGNYSFNWSPADRVSNPNAQQTLTTPLNQSTIFTLDVVDNLTSCQANSDQVQIFVQGGELQLQATASPTQLCRGESVTLTALATGGTANYYYSWTSSPAGFFSGETQPTASPVVSTMYYLTVYDGQQTAFDSVFVAVAEPPQEFMVGGGGILCEAGQSQNITLDGSQTGIKYQLFYNEILLSELWGSGQPLQFGGFDQPGNYTVTAISANGICSIPMAAEATIEQGSVPLAHAGPDKWLTQSGQVTLEGSIEGDENAQFNWNPAVQLLNPEVLQPTTTFLEQTTLFSLEAYNPGCGSSMDYAAVFVGGGELSLEIFNTPAACPGSEVSLFALPGGGSGSYSYQWTSNPAGFESSILNPVVYPEIPTWYILVLSEGSQTVTDSVLITPRVQPQLFELSGGGNYCAGEAIPDLVLSGSEIQVEYTLWHNGLETEMVQLGTGFALSFEMIFGEGNYQVFAQASQSDCDRLMSGTASLITYDVPEVFAGSDQTITAGETAALTGDAIGGSGDYSFAWFPEWLVESPDQAITETAPLDQTTLFYLAVTDTQSLCESAQDTLIVVVVGGSLSARILAEQTQLCTGQKFVALALPNGGSGVYNYQWTNETGEILSDSMKLITEMQESSWIYLELDDGESVVTDSIFVSVAQEIQQFMVTGGGSFCQSNEMVSIGLSGSEAGLNYTLKRGAQSLVTVVGQGQSINFGQYNVPGIYTVEAFRPGFPCFEPMAGSAVVIKHNAPVVAAGNDQYITQGNFATLQASISGGSGDNAFQWQPENLVQNPNSLITNTLALQQSVQFKGIVRDNQTLCSSEDQVNVFVTGGLLGLEVSADADFVCPGQSVQIMALPSGGSGNYRWHWTANGQPLNAANNIITAFPVTDTWYTATVIAGEESVKDSVLVGIHGLPEVYNLSGGGLYCENQTPPEITLNDSETGMVYKLFNNGSFTGLSKTGTGNSVNFGPQYSQGNYHAIAVSNENCVQLMNGLVEVNQTAKPIVFNLLGGGRWCENEAGNGLYLSGSQIGVNYTLLKNGVVPQEVVYGDGQAIAFESQFETGVYTVEANALSESCSQQMRGAVNLIIDPAPQIDVAGETSACEGDFFSLKASGADSYQWLLDPLITANEISFPAEKDTAIVLIGINSLGCSDSVDISLSVNPNPPIELEINPDLKLIAVEPNTFVQYDFYSDNEILQSGSSNQFVYAGLDLPDDSVHVTAITGESCLSKASVYIEPFNVSNAFTPNGDGINDVFRKGDFIRVFSRWGVEIFTGDQGWDGRYNGKMVSAGTYYYLHEIRDGNGEIVRTEKGSVTLVIE
ncbi:MAG: gliding motility-associated C-terminal domain-containing protein [Bacteroidetes bacterium]|nr:gliding motility-associated C-terminal domain-containing protein [Bacteroidota bacterium]